MWTGDATVTAMPYMGEWRRLLLSREKAKRRKDGIIEGGRQPGGREDTGREEENSTRCLSGANKGVNENEQ
eukprot:2636970-Pleurochrysis_carterae.AAC.1